MNSKAISGFSKLAARGAWPSDVALCASGRRAPTTDKRGELITGALKKSGRFGGAALVLMASGGAFALNTGTDANLSLKPASGGMAGAAYTKPQEGSAAVFGNPAALTQFRGTQFGFGAAYLAPKLKVTQTGAAGTRTSQSEANDYGLSAVSCGI